MIRIGTRASALARAQAAVVAERLHDAGLAAELVLIRTRGDVEGDVPLWAVDGKGFFVKELEEALLEEIVDLAVHSAKDLPASLPQGLEIYAVPKREDPRDALVTVLDGGWASLGAGSRVGTSSLRRVALLKALRPGVVVEPLRGNVDTRVRRVLEERSLDAVVLAAAGLHRLGRGGAVTEYLDPDEFTPAAAQGIIAVEGRSADRGLGAGVRRALNDAATWDCFEVERAFLDRLGAGCRAAVGALARVVAEDVVEVSGLVGRADGTKLVRARVRGERRRPGKLGRTVAEACLERGGDAILADPGVDPLG